MKHKVGVGLFAAVCFFIAWCVFDQRQTQKELLRQQQIEMRREEDRHRANQTPAQKKQEWENWLNRDHHWNPDLKIWE